MLICLPENRSGSRWRMIDWGAIASNWHIAWKSVTWHSSAWWRKENDMVYHSCNRGGQLFKKPRSPTSVIFAGDAIEIGFGTFDRFAGLRRGRWPPGQILGSLRPVAERRERRVRPTDAPARCPAGITRMKNDAVVHAGAGRMTPARRVAGSGHATTRAVTRRGGRKILPSAPILRIRCQQGRTSAFAFVRPPLSRIKLSLR